RSPVPHQAAAGHGRRPPRHQPPHGPEAGVPAQRRIRRDFRIRQRRRDQLAGAGVLMTSIICNKARRMNMRFKIIVSVAVLGSAVAACDKTDDFTDEEWAKIRALEPLAGTPPPNPYNPDDQDEAVA